MTFQIKQNGQTLAIVTTDTAEDALTSCGHTPSEITDEIAAFIDHHDLNWVNYGTTYAFATDNSIVAVRGN